jgi:hypothetical protein
MGYRSWAPWVVALAWACGGSAVEAAPKKGGNLKTIQYVARDVSGKYDLQVTLTAGHVNKATLDLLRQGLRFELVDKSKRKDLDFWEDDPLEPKSGEPEVRIDARPLLPPPAGSRFVWRWPEIFVISRPGILTIRPEYSGIHPTQRLPRPTLPPPGDTFEHLSGRLECEAPDGTGTVRNPIPHVRVRVGEREATTDAAGNFTLDLEFDDVPPTLRLVYDSTVPKTGTPLATPFSIIDDFHQARTEDVTLPGRAFIAGDTVVLPAVTVQGGDCEIWRIGVASLQDYHDEVGATPPAGRLRIKRWWGVLVGGIYAFYDYVVLRSDFVDGVRRTASGRLNTLHHEFGHTIRHFADGDEYHWNWDNFRWVYARAHDGDEIFSMHYAFNEGWAQYWEAASLGQTVPTGGVPGLDYMDWNEMRIGERLLDLGAPGEATRAQMVQVLTDNPGVIHTLWEFEQKYCELIRDNTYCAGGNAPRGLPAGVPQRRRLLPVRQHPGQAVLRPRRRRSPHGVRSGPGERRRPVLSRLPGRVQRRAHRVLPVLPRGLRGPRAHLLARRAHLRVGQLRMSLVGRLRGGHGAGLLDLSRRLQQRRLHVPPGPPRLRQGDL